MEHISRSFTAIVVVAALGGFASSVRAQSSFSAGFQFDGASQGGSWTRYPVGFFVDGAKQFTPMFAFVGEFGGVYHPEFHLNVTNSQYSYQGGVRFTSATSGVSPYVQVLVGGATNSATGGGSIGVSKSAFSTQVGGGLAINTSGPPKVRIGVDYRRVAFSQADGGGENDVRFMIGLAFPVGRSSPNANRGN